MKKFVCVILSVVMLCACCLVASAEAEKAVFNIISETTNLKPNDEFTVKIQVDNQSENGVQAFEFSMVFDMDCFEFISATELGEFAERDFTVLKPKENEGLITSVYLDMPITKGKVEVCELKFKVLDKAPAGGTRMYMSKGSFAAVADDNVVDITGEKFGDLNFNIESDYTRATEKPVVQGGTSVEYVPVTQKKTDAKGEVVTNTAGHPVTENVTNEKGEQLTSAIYRTEVVAPNATQGNSGNQQSTRIPGIVWVLVAVVVAAVVLYIIFITNKKK
ncbi:MAG: hypothetical protein IJF54_06095 [Clostridia bacterium]|nr:hypothetical protein [Clostridia bacterium]